MDAFTRFKIQRKIRKIAQDSLSVERVTLFELLKYPNFDLTCVAILGDRSNYLYGYSVVGLSIYGFHHLAERSLAQQAYGTI
jgi:hypothetical protein